MPIFEGALPEVTGESTGSVVILRLRGKSDLGTSFMDVMARYASRLHQVGSRLMVVSASVRVVEQLRVTGVTGIIGAENVYPADEWLGATLARAHSDATAWIQRHA